jgi:CO dehydrogenase nickel-insertion accessory protein CooC1
MMNTSKLSKESSILAGTRIGVFGKGGSGKSTIVVLLANGLIDCGYEVCVLDADSTNIGLSRALGIEQSPEPLMGYFGGMSFSGGLVTCPVDDPTPLVGCKIFLDELPSRYYCRNHSGISLLVAGKIGDKGPGAGCDGPISKIARDLRIYGREANPVTLVDFKAGFEDTARGAITGLDWAIVIVDPTIAAVEMAFNMQDMVTQIRNGRLPATQHLKNPELVAIANQLFLEARIKGALFLINKIKNEDMESYIRTKLAEREIEADGVILEDPSISVSWLKGTALELNRSQADLLDFIKKLEAAENRYSVNKDKIRLRGRP